MSRLDKVAIASTLKWEKLQLAQAVLRVVCQLESDQGCVEQFHHHHLGQVLWREVWSSAKPQNSCNLFKGKFTFTNYAPQMKFASFDPIFPDGTMIRTCWWAKFPQDALCRAEIHDGFLHVLLLKTLFKLLRFFFCTMEVGCIVAPDFNRPPSS